jgi:hypothetical protein
MIARMPTALHFEGPRLIEPAWPDERDVPWLDRAALSEDDTSQLLERVLKRYDETLTLERVVRGTARELFQGRLEGFDEVAVECWDVVDDDGWILYHLWLFFHDSGVLLDAESTSVVAEVMCCDFYNDGTVLDSAEERELGRALHAAQKKLGPEWKHTQLANVTFMKSYTY